MTTKGVFVRGVMLNNVIVRGVIKRGVNIQMLYCMYVILR